MGVSKLVANKVRDQTRQVYVQSLLSFLSWRRLASLPHWEKLVWDGELTKFVEHLFDQSAPRSEAVKTTSALIWARPP